MLIQKLRKQECFSSSEQIIAKYILNYPKEFIFESIDRIAEKTYTSPATIVRFSKKLGFEGFSDLKIRIASELSSFDSFDKRIEVDMPFLPDSSTETIVETFFKLPSQVLNDAYKQINRNKIIDAANLLRVADSIILLGSGPSHLIVSNLHYNLRRLGMNVKHDATIGYQHHVRMKNSKREVAFIVSNFANSSLVSDWIHQLRNQDIKIILVTTNGESPFINLVDVEVVINIEENQVWKMGTFASRTALTYAVDCIYGVLFNMDYLENVDTLYKSTKRLGYQDDIDLEMYELEDQNTAKKSK